MRRSEKALIKAKRIECLVGFFMLIPSLLSVLSFVFCLFGDDSSFAKLNNISSSSGWTCDFSINSGGGMSAAPLYLGLMALAGVYLIKDSIVYLFVTDEEKKDITTKDDIIED